MSVSIVLSIGKYGGFYFRRTNGTMVKNVRLCLGWVSFDIMTPELDVYLDNLLGAVRSILADIKDCQ